MKSKTLDPPIGVRIPASQPTLIDGFKREEEEEGLVLERTINVAERAGDRESACMAALTLAEGAT